MTGECDGFCWYDLELRPKQPVKLSLLRLEIPRRAATASYLHAANFTWTYLSQGLPEYGGQWSDKFIPLRLAGRRGTRPGLVRGIRAGLVAQGADARRVSPHKGATW